MAIQFLEDWSDSLGNITSGGRWDYLNDVSSLWYVNSAQGPFNDGALAMTGANGAGIQMLRRYFSTTIASFVCGFWIKLQAQPNQNNTKIISFWDLTGNAAQLSLVLNTNSSTFVVKRGDDGGTALATASVGLTLNAWTFVEFKATIATGTGGTIQLKQNGSDVVASTGSLNTQNTGNAYMNCIQIGVDAGNRAGFQYIFGSMYFADTASGNVTTFTGISRVYPLVPNGPGANTDFTPLAANNWSEVSKNPSTGDASYNASATVGAKDSFVHTSLPTQVVTVYGIQNVVYARIDDAGTRTVAGLLDDGANTEANASSVGVGANYSSFEFIREFTVGNTSSTMTPTYVNALKIGYKVNS